MLYCSHGFASSRSLLTIGLSTASGIIVWNTLLNVTNASSVNVDNRVLGLSAQDVGSGITALLVTALVMRFGTERELSLKRLVGASAALWLVTVVVDLFG